MFSTTFYLTVTIFVITVLFIILRPQGINEAIPATFGAIIIFAAGIVTATDFFQILGTVSGASITILSTIVMSIVLESIGFFRWAAINIINRARGSGIKLYWYTNLLCFLMTMFFNNDGSILITTPIIIEIVTLLKMKHHQMIPYLFSGALIATGASAPIGVSNLANLIALKIVNLDLNSYAALMFVPSMIGLMVLAFLLYFYFKKSIPVKIAVNPIPVFQINPRNPLLRSHPLANSDESRVSFDWAMFRLCMAIVVLVRIGLFIASYFGIPHEIPAIMGAFILILIRWYKYGSGVKDVIRKTPWHIILFAISMYVIVSGLKNVGGTSLIVEILKDIVASNHFHAIFIMGILLSMLSNIFNNLPAVMVGTLSLLDMNLDLSTLQVAYLANVIGSDIGSLLTPMGTLASLIWMFLIRKNNIPFTWGQYVRVTIVIVPITLLVTLLSLYLWTELLFF